MAAGARGQVTEAQEGSQAQGEPARGESVPERPRHRRGRDDAAQPVSAEERAATLVRTGGKGQCSQATPGAEKRRGRWRGEDWGRAVSKAGGTFWQRSRRGQQQDTPQGTRGRVESQTGQGGRGGDGVCPQVDDGVRGSGPRCRPGAGRGPCGVGGARVQVGHQMKRISLGSCYHRPGLRTAHTGSPSMLCCGVTVVLTGHWERAFPSPKHTQPAPQTSSCTSRIGPSAAVMSTISPRRWLPSRAAGPDSEVTEDTGLCPGAWRGAPGLSGP